MVTLVVEVIILMLQIINIIFFLIPRNPRATFETLVSSFTLRASLIPLSSLILITRPTNRESTFVAGNKGLSIVGNLHFIPTYLAYLSTQLFHRLDPGALFSIDEDKLVTVVRASNEPTPRVHIP
jgi:hypothetical protein